MDLRLQLLLVQILSLTSLTTAFQTSTFSINSQNGKQFQRAPITSLSGGKYVPIYEVSSKQKKKKTLYPKAGDIVRYCDLDDEGGSGSGEVLVGKLAYIQKMEGHWMAEVNELEDVGDGFYAEYGFRQRNSKKSLRRLEDFSPIAGSFVRSEYAYRIPRDKNGIPRARVEEYDINSYKGPLAYTIIDFDILDSDLERYEKFKGNLLSKTAQLSAIGLFLAVLLKGQADAIAYTCGSAAGIFYLLLLYIKTDTVGSDDAKYGKSISNVRFAAPFIAFVIVSLYNLSLGEANPIGEKNDLFSTVTADQYAATTIGFLTYRIPLLIQLVSDQFSSEEINLPGSAGIALKLAKKDNNLEMNEAVDNLKTVLLISGPQAAGRTELVKRLISESDGRYVEPNMIDGLVNAINFELLESKDEFLMTDQTGRYGLTGQSILDTNTTDDSVVIIDADTSVVKKLSMVAGIRLIGVWVSLDATEKFEDRLKTQIAQGMLTIPEDESESSFIRKKIKEVVSDIEYGITSGIFEFTILSDDQEKSIKELKDAASYCFR
mmetsp:Transcript_30733/g.35037  ORF Transcript_30733/g.35037 Transcript_30733/m.35037 type:complete len:546 (+) Transcript_30733:8-1645(+)|eukprot:CAMPEP_0194166122 /NCGR_PEP_ID=MMETSP0154-20130528/1817_1 /TAXON_ID=1049557 /ORGANISM="Thalassiothrix antarctica, Strain L6-D1" /LENGTH=545 /DNA_ID=CAMNT_0038876705 /DNA_START=8 /DNA_END=1645 /DNA_ORIENTATION=+